MSESGVYDDICCPICGSHMRKQVDSPLGLEIFVCMKEGQRECRKLETRFAVKYSYAEQTKPIVYILPIPL